MDSLSTEVEKMLEKRCNKPSTRTKSRFLLTTIRSAKKGWGPKTYNKPKEAEQLHVTRTFQYGKHHNVERHPKEWGLHDKSRSKGCLLQGTHSKNTNL